MIRLLRPLLLVRFGTIRCDRIAHFFWECCEIHFKQRNKNFYSLDLYWIRKNNANSAIAKLISRNVKVFNIVEWVDKWNHKVPGGQKHSISDHFNSWRDFSGKITFTKNKLKLTASEIEFCYKWLKAKGWQPGQPFVILLVRDSAFLSNDRTVQNYINGKDLSYHNYRDTNIEDYQLAVNWLVNKGIFVIRAGKIMHSPLNFQHENFLDYPFCDDQDDLLDVFFFSKCNFCITTGTGPDLISLYYQIPRLLINTLPLLLIQRTGCDTIIPKKLINEKDKTELSLTEYLNASFTNTTDYEINQISYIENSPYENLIYVKEFYNRIKSNINFTSKMQKRAIEVTKAHPNFLKYHNYYNPQCLYSEKWLSSKDSSFLKTPDC